MCMRVIAIVQARLGSSRLPGKVMFPLAGVPVLAWILRRLDGSEILDEVVVATSDEPHDDVVADLARREGAEAFRGDETDVLGRMVAAASAHDAEVVVRICADTPFVSARIVDPCVRTLVDGEYDYATTKLKRTFPVGYGAEAFTMESFRRVDAAATDQHEREHVTVRYRENAEGFERANLTSEAFFDEERYWNRGDVRLTLDWPADYLLVRRIYEHLDESDRTIERVIDFVDRHDLPDVTPDEARRTRQDDESG